MPINKLTSYEEVELPIEKTSQIPSFIKMNSDVNNPRFIADGMNEFERNIKRIGDFLLSGISLIIFSPLFVICYILVKREDGGPAIFKQERIGRFGRPFYIYKFRSMRVDAEKNGPQLFGHKKDTRMTNIGVFLRDHHLDETGRRKIHQLADRFRFQANFWNSNEQGFAHLLPQQLV